MPKKAAATGTTYLKVGLGGGKSKPAQARPIRQLTNTTKPIGVTTTRLPLGNAPQGRPPTNLGRYLIRPTAESNTGFEMLNDQPDLIDQVNKKFLQLRQLPPGLAPTRLVDPVYTKRPQALERGRKNNISRGWNSPRSQQR